MRTSQLVCTVNVHGVHKNERTCATSSSKLFSEHALAPWLPLVYPILPSWDLRRFMLGTLAACTRAERVNYALVRPLSASFSTAPEPQHCRTRGDQRLNCSTRGSMGTAVGGEQRGLQHAARARLAGPFSLFFRVPVCAARTLNAKGPSRVTLSLQWEHLKKCDEARGRH